MSVVWRNLENPQRNLENPQKNLLHCSVEEPEEPPEEPGESPEEPPSLQCGRTRRTHRETWRTPRGTSFNVVWGNLENPQRKPPQWAAAKRRSTPGSLSAVYFICCHRLQTPSRQTSVLLKLILWVLLLQNKDSKVPF